MLFPESSPDGLSVQDVAPARHEAFDASKRQADRFRYIEISGLRSYGTATSEPTLTEEAPSRASQKVHKGDIITSTVRKRCWRIARGIATEVLDVRTRGQDASPGHHA